MNKLKTLLQFAIILLIVSCQNTSDCITEIDFIPEDTSVMAMASDTVSLPYERLLIAKSFSFETDIKSDTLFGSDTVIVKDTLFTDKSFHFLLLNDSIPINHILREGDSFEHGIDKIGDDFNVIRIVLDEIFINNNPDSSFAIMTIYKGVFYSDCSKW